MKSSKRLSLKYAWEKLGIVCACAVFLGLCMTQTVRADIETNKKTVRDFYELAFNGRKPQEAVNRYVGAEYIQHNPFVASGKQPFIDFFVEFQKKHPTARIEIKRVIAEKDLVVVHVHSKMDPNDRGYASMDIFRLEKGKIVEHWDVGQQVPEKPANPNTMF